MKDVQWSWELQLLIRISPFEVSALIAGQRIMLFPLLSFWPNKYHIISWKVHRVPRSLQLTSSNLLETKADLCPPSLRMTGLQPYSFQCANNRGNSRNDPTSMFQKKGLILHSIFLRQRLQFQTLWQSLDAWVAIWQECFTADVS